MFSAAGGAGGGSAGSAGAAGGTASSLLIPTGLSSDRSWDPLAAGERRPTPACLRRVSRDITEVMESPLPGIIVCPDDDDALKVHVLVMGPDDTPYEGGAFYFVVVFPDDYPASPPKARIMTTAGGTVRFGPNLYANGKCCVSILGTWHGPGWSAAMSLTSVLLSIQSLMNAEPYRNEPGFEKTENLAVVKAYNDIITHETMRVAVVDNVARKEALPEGLRSVYLDMFCELADVYAARCRDLAARVDGKPYADPMMPDNKGTFVFGALAARIEELAAQRAKGELT